MKLLGIDEAGRGPVIGPLVITGFMIDDKHEENLKNMGVKDSKLLSPKEREDIYDRLMLIGKHKTIMILPQEIDDALNSDNLNLNWLEAQKSALIINEMKPERAILDCPSNNVKKYGQYVKDILEVKCELIAEHKADLNHLVVGAASIIAKVTRDREIEKIKKKLNQNIGSGYPSDPYTQRFLKENYKKYPEIFRKTWASYKNIVESKKQKGLGEF